MKGQRKILWGVLLCAFFMMLTDGEGAEKEFPSKPLEFIVPFAAGGSTDVMCRTLAARAAPFLNNQPLMVVNKTGAGTVAASKYVLDGKNDGYTLYSTSTSSMMIAPIIHKTDFTWRDFIGIAQTMLGSDGFFVKADVPFNTVEKFIAYAKENPGKIKYATAGAGSTPHLAMEGFAAATGIVIKHIPTKGDSEAIAAILGGHVVATAGMPIPFTPHVIAGKLKCLAQDGSKRDMAFLPDIPTFRELGIDVVLDLWRWVVVPKGTPADRVKVLTIAFRNLLQDKATLESLEKIQCPVSYLPQEKYEEAMKESEVAVSKLVKAAKLEAK